MSLALAILLLVVTIIGIILVLKYLKNNLKLKNICLVILSLIAILLTLYILITIYFVYEVSKH